LRGDIYSRQNVPSDLNRPASNLDFPLLASARPSRQLFWGFELQRCGPETVLEGNGWQVWTDTVGCEKDEEQSQAEKYPSDEFPIA
jgi:hypothetical protein